MGGGEVVKWRQRNKVWALRRYSRELFTALNTRLWGQVGRVSPRVVGYLEALPRSSGGTRTMDELVSIQAHQRIDLRLGGGRAEKVGEASIMLADDGVCA